MKFFFPDSQDQIDPLFDFVTEEHSIYRVRQRDDRYAHEALAHRCYDGILVSKTIVDGTAIASGKYTQPQRNRLYRQGVQQFFRLDTIEGPRMLTMGDCGAFSYVREDVPPYTPDEVIDFYSECRFDLGISVDHVILGFDPAIDNEPPEHEWHQRQRLTIDLANAFKQRCRVRHVGFEPVGVAQGWSPKSYARAVSELQKIGFERIALGGMVPLKTPEILRCLTAIADVRHPNTQLHLLGVTRTEHVERFTSFGVTSFDSTSPFRQSFKDDRDNYYFGDDTYTAVRVPQVDGNMKLKAAVRAGKLDQGAALALEQRSMRLLHAYDTGETDLETVIDALDRYADYIKENTTSKKDSTRSKREPADEQAGSPRSKAYREILNDKPWKSCPCGICEAAGINVAIFRGSERNKRRGFHNLYVFSRRLQRELAGITP